MDILQVLRSAKLIRHCIVGKTLSCKVTPQSVMLWILFYRLSWGWFITTRALYIQCVFDTLKRCANGRGSNSTQTLAETALMEWNVLQGSGRNYVCHNAPVECEDLQLLLLMSRVCWRWAAAIAKKGWNQSRLWRERQKLLTEHFRRFMSQNYLSFKDCA